MGEGEGIPQARGTPRPRSTPLPLTKEGMKHEEKGILGPLSQPEGHPFVLSPVGKRGKADIALEKFI